MCITEYLLVAIIMRRSKIRTQRGIKFKVPYWCWVGHIHNSMRWQRCYLLSKSYPISSFIIHPKLCCALESQKHFRKPSMMMPCVFSFTIWHHVLEIWSSRATLVHHRYSRFNLTLIFLIHYVFVFCHAISTHTVHLFYDQFFTVWSCQRLNQTHISGQ